MWIQTIFKDENVCKKHGSISGYIHGIKHDVQIVKFFLKYDDKKAKLAMEKNISKGLITEFIVIPDRIEEIKRNLAPITAKENSARSINAQRRSRIDEIIRERATDIYRNHSDVFGLRISNVRNVGGALIEDPCIVIYCLDKSFIPANENKLPTEIDGYKCDIRENIIMFGGGGNLGSSIGTPYDVKFGSIGFFAKSNFTTDIPASGFLTAAHVAITELTDYTMRRLYLQSVGAGNAVNLPKSSISLLNQHGLTATVVHQLEKLWNRSLEIINLMQMVNCMGSTLLL